MRPRATEHSDDAQTARGERAAVATAHPEAPLQLNSAEAVIAMQQGAGNAAVARALAPRRALARSPAQEFIDTRAGWLGAGIDEEKIGKDLVNDHLVPDPAFVDTVLNTLESADRDDVALAMIEEGDMSKLREAARNPTGRRVLLRAVRELGGGWTTSGEAGRMRELLDVINEENARADGAARNIEVEVITFETGSLDAIGRGVDSATGAIDAVNSAVGLPVVPNPTGDLTQGLTGRRQLGPGVRGHTALSVDGVIYSFENEWNIGGTRDEYIAAKVAGGFFGTGLVVQVSAEGARQLQAALVGRVDEGAYLVGGEGICVDAAAAQLQKILPGIPGHPRFDVQAFHNNLDASGLVTARRRYDNTTAGAGR